MVRQGADSCPIFLLAKAGKADRMVMLCLIQINKELKGRFVLYEHQRN